MKRSSNTKYPERRAEVIKNWRVFPARELRRVKAVKRLIKKDALHSNIPRFESKPASGLIPAMAAVSRVNAEKLIFNAELAPVNNIRTVKAGISVINN